MQGSHTWSPPKKAKNQESLGGARPHGLGEQCSEKGKKGPRKRHIRASSNGVDMIVLPRGQATIHRQDSLLLPDQSLAGYDCSHQSLRS